MFVFGNRNSNKLMAAVERVPTVTSMFQSLTHSELEQLFINSSVSSGTQTSNDLIRKYLSTGYWLG